MPADMITQELLRERFDYSPETGLFTSRISTMKFKPGDVVGFKDHGYIRVFICGTSCQVHRLIFMWITGRWPKEIDHINHDRADNRWSNLREVSHAENHKNRSKQTNSASGVMGVTFDKSKGRWRARLRVNGKYKNFGWHDSMTDAIAARESAEREYGFHPNHGIA